MDSIAIISLAISILALGYTVIRDRKMDVRVKMIEADQAKEKAEIARQKSKASAPYLVPCSKLVGHVYESTDDGGVGVWTFGKANLLTSQHKEVPKTMPAETSVVVVLENHGKDARRIQFSGDIPDISIHQEPNIDSAKGHIFIKYPYEPDKHGTIQKIAMSFETLEGTNLTHIYQTRHGFFEFQRIDPA